LARLAGQDVGAGIVDPDVDVFERRERVGNDRGTAIERGEVGLEEVMRADPPRVAKLVCEFTGGVGRAAEADPDAGTGGGEGDGDCPADSGAGSGDDRAQTGERQLSGLRDPRLVAGRR
jgi:hypothetical protein